MRLHCPPLSVTEILFLPCFFISIDQKIDEYKLTKSTRSIIAGDKNKAIGIDMSRPNASDPWEKIKCY